MDKCPRSEPRRWNPQDVAEIECPGCGQGLELFADEKQRKCGNCGQMVENPNAEVE